jgi:TonB family protein
VDLDWSTGRVRLAYVVDEQGRIGQVEVLQGAHPAFTDAALDALLATPYRPAMKDGAPLAMRVLRDYQFKLQHTGVGTVLNLRGPARNGSARAELAPALQQAVWPVYPAGLLRSGVTGSAKVRARIGVQGEVSAVELLAASHPDFGRAAVAMMQAWRFEPSGTVASPQRTLEYEQRFSATQPAESGVPASAAPLLERLALGGAAGIAGVAGIAGAGELDAALRPLLQVQPVMPTSLRQARAAGSATVDFYVDAQGRVLLPELASASQEDFGWAALTAVNQWRFEPPRRGGQPVVARGRVQLKAEAPP